MFGPTGGLAGYSSTAVTSKDSISGSFPILGELCASVTKKNWRMTEHF